MPFTSVSQAARIELADSRLLIEASQALAARRPDARVLVREIAGGVATFATQGSPLNKVVGLGFAGPVDEGELEEVEGAFAERGAPLQVELSSLADASVGAMLTRRGYVLHGFESVLGRALGAELPPPAPVPGIEVGPCSPEEGETWLDALVTGFAHPDEHGAAHHETHPREVIAEAISDMLGARGFERFLARRGGSVAGGASLRIWEDVALLCGAATLPEHRRRGVQSALLAQRLARASAAGCRMAVVTTQPGSKSCANVQRQGFEVLYARAILVRGASALA